MVRIAAAIVTGFLLVCLSVVVPACQTIWPDGMPWDPPGTVGVAVGDDWPAIQAASSQRFSKQNPTGYSVQRPVTLRYADPAHGFDLPTGNAVWFTMKDGRVDWIYALPHTHSLDWTGVTALVADIAGRLDRAGWQPDRPPRLDAARRYYDAPLSVMGTYAVALYQADDRTAEIQVYRLTGYPNDQGTPAPEPERFTVSVRIRARN